MASGQEVSVSLIVVSIKNPGRRDSGSCCHWYLEILHMVLVSTAHICGDNAGAKGSFTDSFYDESACNIVAFGHHVPNDGMLAPREYVKCTVLAGADGASEAARLFKTDSMFLVVDCARSVFDNCLFFLLRNARHRSEGVTDFAVSALIFK